MLAIVAGASLSAHRTDEYLQAARLAIDPDRVQIELDLTPGIAVAGDVLAGLDTDRDGSISPAEARTYLGRVLSGITLELDGAPLAVQVTGSTFPAVDAVRGGEGTIRIGLSAATSRLDAGVHHLRYGNAHRRDIGVYLANALVPASDRVAITDQQRDVDQHDLRVEYRLSPETTRLSDLSLWLSIAGALVAVTAACWWTRGLTPARRPRLRYR